jgi:DNA-binding transcriptional regulator YiaG
MTAHPNRSRRTPSAARSPTPAAIRAAREAAGLTQLAAARIAYSTLRAWQWWESGGRAMHPAIWELWTIKAQAIPQGSLKESPKDRTSPKDP